MVFGIGLLFLFTATVHAADTCDVARSVAERAAAAYEKDKKRGTDLFVKAYRLCSQNGAFAYNAAMAWLGRGKLSQAQKYLERAVKKDDSRAVWHNNLASVMLKRGKDPQKALAPCRKGRAPGPGFPGNSGDPGPCPCGVR